MTFSPEQQLVIRQAFKPLQQKLSKETASFVYSLSIGRQVSMTDTILITNLVAEVVDDWDPIKKVYKQSWASMAAKISELIKILQRYGYVPSARVSSLQRTDS